MIKYRISNLFVAAKITEVEVVRETASFVFIMDGREKREATHSAYHSYYNTWEEAHAALLEGARRQLEATRNVLERQKCIHGNIKGMRQVSVTGRTVMPYDPPMHKFPKE